MKRPAIDLIVEVEKMIRTIPDPATAARLIVKMLVPASHGRSSEATPTGAELLAFPCDGLVRSWAFTEGERDDLTALFPSLDVLAEARLALAWVLASPERRKTAGGMRRFLTAWLTRSQNRGRPPVRVSPLSTLPRRISGPSVEETDRRLAAARVEAARAAESWPRGSE